MLNTLKDALSKFEDNDKLTLNPLKNLKRIIDDGWVYFSATAILMLIDPVNIKFAEDGFSMFHLNLFTSLMIILAVAAYFGESDRSFRFYPITFSSSFSSLPVLP